MDCYRTGLDRATMPVLRAVESFGRTLGVRSLRDMVARYTPIFVHLSGVIHVTDSLPGL